MDDDMDVAIAERADTVPLEFLDDIVAEYQRAIIFDGQQLVAAEG